MSASRSGPTPAGLASGDGRVDAKRPGAPFTDRLAGAGATALGLAVAHVAASYTVADVDLWGHLRFGQDIRLAGAVVQQDRYSYLTDGQEWVNHEWLAEVIFSATWDGGGATGLVALKAALVLAAFAVALWHLRRQGLRLSTAGLLLLPVVLAMAPGVIPVRPQLFSYLFFALVLAALRLAEEGRTRWLVAAPVAVAAWSNFHGGVLAGLGVVTAWAVARAALGGGPSRERFLALVAAAACVPAAAANPYGLELLRFLLATATVPRPEITEWAPIAPASVRGFSYLVLLGLAGAGLFFTTRPRRPGMVAALVASAAMPLVSVRHLQLFAVAMVVVVGEHLASAVASAAGRALPRPLTAAAGALGVAAAAVLSATSLANYRAIRLKPEYPVRAVAWLQASGVAANLAVHFDWGEYVIWHLGPRVRVSVDGRRETLYSDAVYAENLEFRTGGGDWARLVRRPQTDLALVSTALPVMENLRAEPGWEVVYEDPVCGLFARRGSALAERLRRTPVPGVPYDGRGTDFP